MKRTRQRTRGGDTYSILKATDENASASQRKRSRGGTGLGGAKKKQKKQLTDITNTRKSSKRSKKEKMKSGTKKENQSLLSKVFGVMTRSRSKQMSGKKSKTDAPSVHVVVAEKDADDNHVVLEESTKENVDDVVSAEAVEIDLSCQEKVDVQAKEELEASSSAALAKPQYVNIDMVHANDEKYPVEYAEDIYANARDAEIKFAVEDPNYMRTIQTDISESMRGILVDWLIEVADEYRLNPKTLHLSVNTIDRVLSKRTVSRGKLQLVGCACMLLAGKYEEIFPPTVEDYSYISDNTYTPHQVLEEERRVLNDIDYVLTVPTMHMFLARYLEAAHATTKQKHLAQYFCEIALLHMEFVKFKPSMIAATAVYYMRMTLASAPNNETLWDETLKYYTQVTDEKDLHECCVLMNEKHRKTKDSELRAVYEKFESDKFSEVARLQPLEKISSF